MQTSGVLELQRDAIVIVSLDQNSGDGQEDEKQKRTPDQSDTTLRIELSNIKSQELFGLRLSDASFSLDASQDRAIQQLDLPQFVV